MSADRQALVICESCHRPQLSGGSCVGCGAPLPPASQPRSLSDRDRLLEAQEPFFEGDFGHGKILMLSRRHLQWRAPRQRAALRFPLADIAKLELHHRPVWESLLIPLVATPAWFGHSRWIILAWGALAIWGVAACLFQRRYWLEVTLKDGRRRRIYLDFGRGSAPPVKRIWSIWDSLVPELSALSVEAHPR